MFTIIILIYKSTDEITRFLLLKLDKNETREFNTYEKKICKINELNKVSISMYRFCFALDIEMCKLIFIRVIL